MLRGRAIEGAPPAKALDQVLQNLIQNSSELESESEVNVRFGHRQDQIRPRPGRARCDFGRAAARREHRHGRARDGQFRAVAACGSSSRATAGRTSPPSAPPPAPTTSWTAPSCSIPSSRRSPTLTLLFATTARAHDQAKPVVAPEGAAREIAAHIAGGGKAGILFGRERYGPARTRRSRSPTASSPFRSIPALPRSIWRRRCC